MQNFFRDFQYCLRLLRKNMGFTFIAVLTMALGIGANTAVFSVVNTLLLKSLPYPQAEKIVFVWMATSKDPQLTSSMSPLNFDDLRRASQSFEAYCAFRYTSFALTQTGAPVAVNGVMISNEFGQVTGVAPLLGRTFTPTDDVPGKERVIILSHGFWQRQFGADPRVIGRTVQLNGEAVEIIGVMPATFSFPSARTEVWKPLALEPAKVARGTSFLQTAARLKPSVTIEQAQAEATAIAGQILQANAQQMTDMAFNVVPLRTQLVGHLERPVLILFGAVLLVLFIACVNVANLTLGRATVRWREIALRAALGASRWSLMRLLLLESLLLSFLGGGLGLVLANFGIDLILQLNPDVIPRSNRIEIDYFVIAFTFCISGLTGILFGLVPALSLSSTELNQTLRENSHHATGSGGTKWLRHSLVIAEIGLSLVLLVSAGLLLRSFWNLLQVDPGFRADNVVSTQINLPRARYQDEWQRAEFFRSVLSAVRAIPGVQFASATSVLPFDDSRSTTSFNIDGRVNSSTAEVLNADEHAVFPDYFRTLGIPLKAGRDFSATDDRSHPGVIIINEKLAQQYFPQENPLGKRITVGTPEEEKLYGKAVSREIIGVIGNVKLLDLGAAFEPEIYVPALQLPSAGMVLTVRGTLPAEQLINSLRQSVASLDAQIPLRQSRLMASAVQQSLAPQRFIAGLLFAFAGIALALALIGIYGVMNYAVTQRTHEIGIRMALGAQRIDIMKMLLSQSGILIGIGLMVGLCSAYFATKLLQGLLFEVKILDLTTFVGVAALLAGVALLACFFPARRATKIEPIIALRYE